MTDRRAHDTPLTREKVHDYARQIPHPYAVLRLGAKNIGPVLQLTLPISESEGLYPENPLKPCTNSRRKLCTITDGNKIRDGRVCTKNFEANRAQSYTVMHGGKS